MPLIQGGQGRGGASVRRAGTIACVSTLLLGAVLIALTLLDAARWGGTP